MELYSKVSHQVWVFNAFKYFQLICSLLDCFMIIWLESDLFQQQEKKCVTSTSNVRPFSYFVTDTCEIHTSFMAISSPVSTLMQVYTFPYWPSPIVIHKNHNITACSCLT